MSNYFQLYVGKETAIQKIDSKSQPVYFLTKHINQNLLELSTLVMYWGDKFESA